MCEKLKMFKVTVKIPKTIIAGCLLAGVLAMASNASALSINDGYYVGQISPGTPASEANEAEYAQYLIDLFNGVVTDSTDVDLSGPTNQNFTETTGGLTGPLPAFGGPGAHLTTGTGANDTSGTYDVTGVLYLYAYYGNGGTPDDGQLWYVSDLQGSVSIPTQSLSHVTLGGGTSVPDAGATMVLFGAGLLGVGALRRRLSK